MVLVDHTTQRVSAVSRKPGNLDLFVIGNDGKVASTFWSATDGWRGDWMTLPGNTTFDHTTQQVTAVSRKPGNLDLFAIGNDGKVATTFWSATDGWRGDWMTLPGNTTFDHTTQQVTAVSRAPGHLDLFAIRDDNKVVSTFWSATAGTPTGWRDDWFQLPGNATFNHITRHVTALSVSPGALLLLAIGDDNKIFATGWTSARSWVAEWGLLTPSAPVLDNVSQRITSVLRSANDAVAFAIATDNKVGTSGPNTFGWNPLPGTATFDHATQQVAAVSRKPGNLDLFAIGNDGKVATTFWTATDGWRGDWMTLPGNTTFDHTTQQVTAVSRAPGHLDLFAIRDDNTVATTFWSATGTTPTGWRDDWQPLS